MFGSDNELVYHPLIVGPNTRLVGDQSGELLRCHVQECSTPYDQCVASMFDTIADMLRGSAPDDLAHALGTDRTQTRRAMEIGLPALIAGLRDKTLEPGGAQNLASMLGEPGSGVPDDLDAYIAAGDPAQGAAMLDVAFGDRGESSLAALSSASGLSTRLLAQVMSVLAPLATGTVASYADRSTDGLRSYLADAVEDLEGKGFGRVVELVSPAAMEMPDTVNSSEPAVDPIVGQSEIDLPGTHLSDLDLPDLSDSGIVDSGTAEADLPSAASMVDGDIDMVLDPGAEVILDDDVATVVEGVFADSADDFPSLHEPELGMGEATEAIEIGGSLPGFDTEVANVAPAGVVITGDSASTDAKPSGSPIAEDLDADTEGSGLSKVGWFWWLVGAVLGTVILIFAIAQCTGGSDGEGGLATSGETPAAVDPTPDPVVAQRQATLGGLLLGYPNVQGEVFGDVAVLDGTVANETERALLDQAVRAAGLGVQNNVTIDQAATAEAAEGYSLNDLIDAQPELSTLRALLDQAGFAEALGGGGEFTLFAPTNDAFAAISDQVAALQNDPEALKAVLRYHLLVGAQDSATISASSSLPTQLDEQSIDVDASGGSILLNGSVTLLVGDAAARNGVMHIVSSVLLPQEAAPEFPEDIGAALGLAPITFASGGSDLTDAGKIELDKVAAFLLQTPGDIEIGGHTDADGEPGFNQTLSRQRSNAVKTYLEAQGIPAETMTAVGFGEDQPIAPNDTPENKAKNRRIVFRPI